MHSHSWMSRTEAAAHLRISVRQLDRLRLTRSYIGRRALYSREALDAHLFSLQTMPLPRPRHRAANVMPLPGPTRNHYQDVHLRPPAGQRIRCLRSQSKRTGDHSPA